VSLALRVLGAAAIVAAGALTVAALALVRVVPGWAVLFFYVVPFVFFALWTLRELRPGLWRQAVAPVRRSLRQSRIAPPTTVPEMAQPRQREPETARGGRLPFGAGLFSEAAQGWLLVIRSALSTLRAGRGRWIFNGVFVLAAAAMVWLVLREITAHGWPLGHAEAAGTAASVALFISTFALRALGWQRLFRPYERPRSLALVASNGTAAVTAVALPSRVDDAIAIGVLRRIAPRSPSVGTLALSLFLLGLIDMAALAPFAGYTAAATHADYYVRITMLGLTVVGVGAAVLAAALPSIRGSERLVSYRLGHWLAVHAPNSYVDALWSWLLVGASWVTRAGGMYVLLGALGLTVPFTAATAYVVAAAGAAALPIGPAGAATQAGVGAAVLAGAGLSGRDAFAFAVAAQALTVGAGAVLGALGAGITLTKRRSVTT
jgi:uncharacterized membrane protein YbhN (UPF0104 family)